MISLSFNEEALEKILDVDIGGKTWERIRLLILSIYNFESYQKIDLFGMLRNADSENRELI